MTGGNLVLVQFDVGADGYAAFSAKHITTDGTNDLAPAEGYNIARIDRGSCCNTELTAPMLEADGLPYVNAFGDEGYLDFRDGKRFDEIDAAAERRIVDKPERATGAAAHDRPRKPFCGVQTRDTETDSITLAASAGRPTRSTGGRRARGMTAWDGRSASDRIPHGASAT